MGVIPWHYCEKGGQPSKYLQYTLDPRVKGNEMLSTFDWHLSKVVSRPPFQISSTIKNCRRDIQKGLLIGVAINHYT